MSKQTIKVTLPDGTILEKPLGITGLEIAEGISKGLAKESILIELNGQLRDLSFSINLLIDNQPLGLILKTPIYCPFIFL